MYEMELQIISLHHQEYAASPERNVLPFYSRSFERLNEGKAYTCGYGYNEKEQNLLRSSLDSVCRECVPDYYYDLRNWEDFSCPAPQYMLLDSMGWNKVKPLSFLFTNQVDLYLALEHFSLCSDENEMAAFTVFEKRDDKDVVFSFLLINSENKLKGKKTLSEFEIKRMAYNGEYGGLLDPLKLIEKTEGRIIMAGKGLTASILCSGR